MYKTLLLLTLVSAFVSCKKENSNMAKASSGRNTLMLDSISFDLPAGFELEELYSPSDHRQGSWVSLAQGPDDLIYTCDQYGKIYSFKTPEQGKTLDTRSVDSINLAIGNAQGMLWAHNALYVAVNRQWNDAIPDEQENASGIYRLTDTDDDGKLDEMEMLLKLRGEGEHGPHSLVLSPNGKEIYFIAGNHVLIPNRLKENSRLPVNWGEDSLFEPYLDARGHANDIKAPGGWIAKFDPDGSDWQLISAGFRNPFDMAFNQEGELFAYDADMEWDIGMPWYRPTRICHVTSGSEFGWRTGSGKWPAYYPDNLPAVHNLEQGSPTGVLSGVGLNFPERYKNGLFIMDWSFGTIYFIDLKPDGSSYYGEREEFLSGTPLPLTDMIIGSDGHLYFATGGRRIDSRLYRLRYVGPDSAETEVAENTKASELRRLRHDLEKFHSQISDDAAPLAWANLDHEDRFIRYAARMALEHQPTEKWQDKFFDEKNATKIIQAGIALAHQADKGLQSKILGRLNALSLETLIRSDQINLLRNYALVFIRMGKPTETDRVATAKKLNAYFPHADNIINRELGQLLLYLKADGITKGLVDLLEKHAREKTITEGVEMLSEEATLRSEQYGPLIREVIAKMPPSESIYYGMLLSHAKQGWTTEARKKYFQWFFDVMNSKGGMSFKAYIENVRQMAMTHVPDAEKEYFEELSGIYSPTDALENLPTPIGPGKAYTMGEVNDLYWKNSEHYRGSLAQGERAYKAAMCILCHRMKGEGGATGPDLTQMHSKFSSYDLTFSMVSPNDEISDQYANTIFYGKGGNKVIGRLLSSEGDSLSIMPNLFDPLYIVKLAKADVEKQELSPVSPMPPGLLNRLNEKEITDLYAYLLSGADENHKFYSWQAPKK